MVRPWQRDDLKPLPPGTVAGPPDYVGIGNPKCGTTWWQHLLLQHPDVTDNRFRKKELQFFCRPDNHVRVDLERQALYREAFAVRAGGACGEWSAYLTYPRAIERLHAAVPDTKLLVLVRNPVDRLVSHLNHLHKTIELLGLDEGGDRAGYLWRYSLFNDGFNNSLVADPMRRLFELYPRDQVLVLQYERCKADPEGELARTHRFLGLDPVMPENIVEKVNARPHVFPPLTDDERAELVEHFTDEVVALHDVLPELDLSLWKGFEQAARISR
jgi:hypothetical protein